MSLGETPNPKELQSLKNPLSLRKEHDAKLLSPICITYVYLLIEGFGP